MKSLSSCLFFLLIFFCATSFAEINEKLRVACIKGNIVAFEEAKASGADLNAKNANGETVLMLACYRQQVEIVKLLLLLDAGVDVNAQDKFGYTALNFAIMADISDQQTINKLQSIINLLTKHNINTNTTDALLRTPFMLSCFNGWEHSVKKLLKYVSNINSKDSYGNTALALAYGYGYKKNEQDEICGLLLDNKADPNAKIMRGYSEEPILVAAAKNGDVNCVTKLLKIEDIDIDIEAEDDSGTTALMWASNQTDEDNKKIIDMLVDYKRKT